MKHARLTLRHWTGAAGAALALLALAGILWLSPLAAGDEIPLTPETATLTAGNTYLVPAGERVSPVGPVTVEEGATLVVRGELVLEQAMTCAGTLTAEGNGQILQQGGNFTLTGQLNRMTVQNETATFTCKGGAKAEEVSIHSANLVNSGHIARCTFEAMDAAALQNIRFSCSESGSFTALTFRSCGQIPDFTCAAGRIDNLTLLPGNYSFSLGSASVHTIAGTVTIKGEEGARPTLRIADWPVSAAPATAALLVDGGNFECPQTSSCQVQTAVLMGASSAKGLQAAELYLAAAGENQPAVEGSDTVGAVYRRVERTGDAAQAVTLSAPAGKYITGQGGFNGLYCKEGDQVTLTATGSDSLNITRNGMYLAFSNGSATYTASAGFDLLRVRYAPPLSIGMTHTAGTGQAQYTYDPVSHVLILENNCRLGGPAQGDVYIKVTSGAGYIELNKVDQGEHCVTLEPLVRQEGETVDIFIGLDGASHLTTLSSSAGSLFLVKEAHALENGFLTVDGDLAAVDSINVTNIQNLTCKKISAPSVNFNNCTVLCDGIESTNGGIGLRNGSDLTANGPIVLHSQDESHQLSIDSSRLNVCAVGETPIQSDKKIVVSGDSCVTARALPIKGENTPIPAVVTSSDLLLFDGTHLSFGKNRFFYALSCSGAPAVRVGGDIDFSLKTADTPLPTIARPQGGAVIPLEGGGHTFGVGNRPATDVLVSVEPALYTLTVEGGCGSGSQLIGQPAYLTADPAPEGMVFDRWELVSGEGQFADATDANTAFTASAEATVRALYREAPVEPDPDDPVTPDPDDPVTPEPDDPTPPAPDDPVTPEPPADDTPPAGDDGGQTPPTPAPEEGDPSGSDAAPPAQGPEDGASQTGDASALPTWLAILATSLLVAALCKRHFADWKHLQR
ncbi:hypothetical protein H7271_00235 [Bittarella massiliensis]|uniref:hypothetical protein n=1 Tax=Bittarella massiliensis (ex Durand et al. 2017) TaxID=1720313 RepID=UPI00163B96EB|nr:hypothetical protein [Bittarella massiliensis (ex Durand et al. 2017)]MBC2870028.1 hypothetical protein [Bittarella massiliensis (ex Durand et al. 2017)]